MRNYIHNDPEFKELILIVADKLKIEPYLIEKDYWIMHTLYGLNVQGIEFELKGGTSLSKGYGIIDRFSEDIDLTISRAAPILVDVADPIESDISGKERQRRIDALKIGAQSFVAEIAAPALQRKFESRLDQGKWKISIDEFDSLFATVSKHS
jgi:predicted nucleotidyltransferase component of viral defense system